MKDRMLGGIRMWPAFDPTTIEITAGGVKARPAEPEEPRPARNRRERRALAATQRKSRKP